MHRILPLYPRRLLAPNSNCRTFQWRGYRNKFSRSQLCKSLQVKKLWCRLKGLTCGAIPESEPSLIVESSFSSLWLRAAYHIVPVPPSRRVGECHTVTHTHHSFIPSVSSCQAAARLPRQHMQHVVAQSWYSLRFCRSLSPYVTASRMVRSAALSLEESPYCDLRR